MAILLDRRQSRLFAQENTSLLTQSQLHLDSALQSFSEHASDPVALASMTLGSFAYKAARFSFLSGANALGITRFAPRFLINSSVNLAALGVEVSAFRASNNFLGAIAGHAPQQDVFDRKGFLGTTVDFFALKTIGHLGAGQNIALTHFAQANAMTLGHEVSAALGFTEHQTGSYIERLVQSEITNLALGAGMGITSIVTGAKIHHLERGLEARMASFLPAAHPAYQSSLKHIVESLIPRMSRNADSALFASHSLTQEYTPQALGALEGKVIVVANRGEAALRAATTAMRLGLKTVVLCSEGDISREAGESEQTRSWHATLNKVTKTYDIGGVSMMDSYGNIGKLRSTLRKIARDLKVKPENIILWPGWGGAAEDPHLARMVAEEGARFAGPSDFAMELLGPKTSSNAVAKSQGLRPIPSSDRIHFFHPKLENGEVFFRLPFIEAIREFIAENKANENQVSEKLRAALRKNISEKGIRFKVDTQDFAAIRALADILNQRNRRVAIENYQTILPECEEGTMIKGAETGGGRGIRIVKDPRDFEKMLDEAIEESASTSPSGDVLIAKYFAKAHHWEAQVFADAEGNIRIFGVRECSLQRGRQKIQERDITGLLPQALRDYIFSQASELLQGVKARDPNGIGYTNAVTVEFLWNMKDLPINDPFSGDPRERLFVLEANTRLQVEHGATEEAVRLRRNGELEKLDFVELQLRIAAGEKLDFRQEDLEWHFASLQTRVNAEDPYNEFQPSPGRITHLAFPDNMQGIRVDRGVEVNRVISKHYDSNVAKAVSVVRIPAEVRAQATPSREAIQQINEKLADQMSDFLGQWEMAGVRSNIPFHLALLKTPQVRAGLGYDTTFIEREFLASAAGQRSYEQWNIALISAAIATYIGRREAYVSSLSSGRSLDDLSKIEMEIGGNEFQFEVREAGAGKYFAQIIQQKVEVIGQGSVSNQEGTTFGLRQSRTGKFFLLQGESEVELSRHADNTFRRVVSDTESPEIFQLKELQHSITLQGENIPVQRSGNEGWTGTFRGNPIQLVAAESYQHWAKFAPSPTRVACSKSGAIYDFNIAGTNYKTLIDSQQGKRYVQNNGVEYDISVAGEGILSKEHAIAPLSGKIVTPVPLMPKVGDIVEEGQELFTIEAMKQKTSIRARQAGKIVAIHVRHGDLVEPNRSLVVIGSVNEEISPRRDSLPVRENPLSDVIASPLYAKSAKLRVEAAGETYPEALEEHFAWHIAAALGFDVPHALIRGGRDQILALGRTPEARQFALDLLLGTPSVIERTVEAEDGTKSQIKETIYLGGWLDAISSIHTLSHPLYAEAFQNYMNTRDASKLPEALLPALLKALSNFGITSLQPSLALDEALYRIHRARHDNQVSNLAVSNLIDIARELEMRELIPALIHFQRSYVGEAGKGQIPLAHLAQEAQSHLETGDQRQVWSQEFNELLGKALAGESPSRAELIRTPRPAKRFLLEKMGSNDESTVQLATEILFERLYGGREHQGGKHETLSFENSPSENLAIGTFRDHDTRANRSVVFVRVNSLEEIPAALARAKNRLSTSGTQENVIEISMPRVSTDLNFNEQAVEAMVQNGVQNIPHLKLVTFAASRQKAGNGPDAPRYRTYRPLGTNNAFIRHQLFDDIHPMDAWKIFELDRWIPNFVPERIPGVLLPDIYAFRLQDRASLASGKDPRKNGDLRNLVVAQVTGDLTYRRFGASLEGDLIGLYQRLQKKPDLALSPEEEISLRAIPWGLKLAGELPADFSPFTINTMQGPAHAILSEFLSNPSTAIASIQKAARALNGKIYSVPEAERQAINGALTLNRVQATTPGGPLDARIDVYIHAPLDVSKDELDFTVGRTLKHFGDPRIEKTAIRFHRTQGEGYQEYVSSVRTPAGTQIKISEELVTNRAPHEIRTSVEKKEQAAMAKGNLYVYARVKLIEEAIREIWPKELALPADAVRLQEFHLRGGQLVEVDRDPGKNRSGMVVYETTVKFPKDLKGNTYERKMMWVGNDASIDGGSLGPVEAQIYEAAFERAIRLGIPIHYASDSSGAAMAGPYSSFAGQVFRNLRKTWDAKQERWILWATSEQLNIKIGPEGRQKNLSELVTATRPITIEGVEGFEVTDVSGEIFLSSESLRGSAKTARITALANKKIPVFASSHGVTIGIGTYDWVLAILNMIAPGNSAALTGPRAVKETGLGDVRTADEYAGAQRLANAGIASQLVEGELGVAVNMLRMLSMLPSHRGAEAERVETGDNKDRNIAADLQRLIPGRGMPFDMRPVLETIFDQGPLGGTFELWKQFGPTALVGFARFNGRTVAYAFPQPKPDPVSGERGPFFGSTLDSESAFKVANIIRAANRLGIPLVMDPAFAGFMPDAINVSRRVYEGGAEIVRALEEFDGVILQILHPFAEWWGGCVAVSEQSINSNADTTTIAFSTTQVGILGAAPAMSVPKVFRVRDENFNDDPRVIELRTRFQTAPAAEKAQIETELQEIFIDYTNQVKDMYLLVNTAERARNHGSIDRIIGPDEMEQSRGILIDSFESTLTRYAKRKAEEAAQLAAWTTLRGYQHVLTLSRRPSFTLEELADGQAKLCQNGASLCLQGNPQQVLLDAVRHGIIKLPPKKRGARRSR